MKGTKKDRSDEVVRSASSGVVKNERVVKGDVAVVVEA